MTEVERKFMEHLWRLRKWVSREELMFSARRFAETDPYQLSRLPELLAAELKKHEERKTK